MKSGPGNRKEVGFLDAALAGEMGNRMRAEGSTFSGTALPRGHSLQQIWIS